MTDSMSKVEDVALALYIADGFTRAIGSAEESWSGDREDVKERYRVQARAAIAAMKKPSEEMVWAGWEDAGADRLVSPHEVEEIYAAMIDKALEEG